MSDILFVCPACEKRMTVDEKAAGRQCACIDCGEPVAIPEPVFRFRCPRCCISIAVAEGMAGTPYDCPTCGLQTTVPYIATAPDEVHTRTFTPISTIRWADHRRSAKFNCPHCERRLSVPAQALGSTIACPACGGSIHLPPPIGGERVTRQEG